MPWVDYGKPENIGGEFEGELVKPDEAVALLFALNNSGVKVGLEA